MKLKTHARGFTLIELLVTIAIIGLLSTIVYASFDEARKQARDKSRMTALKELQLAIEQYRAQTGQYPSQATLSGCTATAVQFIGPGASTGSVYRSCSGNNIKNYIIGLSPDYIGTLPFDPKFEFETNRGFYYRTDGNSYKLMIRDSAETILITSFDDEFARCPSAGGGCPNLAAIASTYAVYSAGAEAW